MLVFLSDVGEDDGGGHLHFPTVGVKVLPRVGDAVLWRNLTDEGAPDLRVLHEGVAPKQCQKLVPWTCKFQPLNQQTWGGMV